MFGACDKLVPNLPVLCLCAVTQPGHNHVFIPTSYVCYVYCAECRVTRSATAVLISTAKLTCSLNAAGLRHRVLLQHLSDARLKITILGGVDERIDAAAEQSHHHGEVVVPAGEIHGVYADDAQEERDLIE